MDEFFLQAIVVCLLSSKSTPVSEVQIPEVTPRKIPNENQYFGSVKPMRTSKRLKEKKEIKDRKGKRPLERRGLLPLSLAMITESPSTLQFVFILQKSC
jgi:hypothetical protein